MAIESTINKCKKPRHYTKISNALLQDDRLSLKEIGLMAYILSLPDNWTICMSHLYARYGRASVMGSLVSLKKHGYLSHSAERDASSNRITAHRWTAYDDPSENETHHSPVFQSVEIPQCGKTTATKEIGETKETQKQIPTPAPVGGLIDIPPALHKITAEQVYAEYPRKEARAAALKAIEKSLRSAREATGDAGCILRATQEYAAAVALWPQSDRKFIPHAATWFNRASYADDPKNWVRESSTKGRADWAD